MTSSSAARAAALPSRHLTMLRLLLLTLVGIPHRDRHRSRLTLGSGLAIVVEDGRPGRAFTRARLILAISDALTRALVRLG